MTSSSRVSVLRGAAMGAICGVVVALATSAGIGVGAAAERPDAALDAVQIGLFTIGPLAVPMMMLLGAIAGAAAMSIHRPVTSRSWAVAFAVIVGLFSLLLVALVSGGEPGGLLGGAVGAVVGSVATPLIASRWIAPSSR